MEVILNSHGLSFESDNGVNIGQNELMVWIHRLSVILVVN